MVKHLNLPYLYVIQENFVKIMNEIGQLFSQKRILFWKFWLKEDTVLKIWVERGYYFEKISLYPDIDAKLTNQNTGIDYVIMTQDYVINKHDKPDKQIPRSTAFYDKKFILLQWVSRSWSSELEVTINTV